MSARREPGDDDRQTSTVGDDERRTSADADGDRHSRTVDVEHEPARLSAHVAMGAGVVAALTSAPFALLALPFGVGGLAMLAAGLYVAESRTWVSVGAGGIFSGGLLAGAFGGVTAELLLISVIGVMVAWDVGQNAISIGEQLTAATHTRRLELVHAGATAVVATLAAGLAYGVYVAGTGGQPAPALALLLIGAVVLLWVVRR